MDMKAAKHAVNLRVLAIGKLADALQDAFILEKAAVDKLLKEFTKLRKMQVDGYISRDFIASTQASEAWLHKAGTEEQIRLGLPWAKGTATLNPSVLKPLAEVFEYNFSNVVATTSEEVEIEKMETQVTWEIEQAALAKRRADSDMVKIALRRAVSEDYAPEDSAALAFIVVELDHKYNVEVSEAFVKEVLTEMGYFDPNVQEG